MCATRQIAKRESSLIVVSMKLCILNKNHLISKLLNAKKGSKKYSCHCGRRPMILGGFRDIQDIQDFIETMLLVSANNRAIIRMKEAHGNMEINSNGSCTSPHLTFATSFCPLGLVGSGCGDLITCSPFMPCSWICRSQSQSRAIRRIDWAGRLKRSQPHTFH